jgi:hypothetical protein
MKKPEQLELQAHVILRSGITLRLRTYAPSLTTPRGKFLRYDVNNIITAISLAVGDDELQLMQVGGIGEDGTSYALLKLKKVINIDDENFERIYNFIRMDQLVVSDLKGEQK